MTASITAQLVWTREMKTGLSVSKVENPSVHQKAELKKLKSMKEAKTRTVRFREKRMKKQELVEADTEEIDDHRSWGRGVKVQTSGW